MKCHHGRINCFDCYLETCTLHEMSLRYWPTDWERGPDHPVRHQLSGKRFHIDAPNGGIGLWGWKESEYVYGEIEVAR